jgi:hypothetical protein
LTLQFFLLLVKFAKNDFSRREFRGGQVRTRADKENLILHEISPVNEVHNIRKDKMFTKDISYSFDKKTLKQP